MADSLTVQPKETFSISQTEPDANRPVLFASAPDQTAPEVKLPQSKPNTQPDDGFVPVDSLPVDQRSQVYSQVQPQPQSGQADTPDSSGMQDAVETFKGNPKALFDLTVATKGDLNLRRWAVENPDKMQDPQIQATIADAMAMQKERGFNVRDIKWGEAGKALLHLPMDIAKWGSRAADLITADVGQTFVPKLTPKAQAEFDKEQAKQAAELVTGTNVGLEGLAGLIDKGVSKSTRKLAEWTGLRATPTQRTAQEKLDDMNAEIEAEKRRDLTARGYGVLTQTFLGGVMKDLERDGVKLDPQAVNTFAAGDPVTFVAFGKGFDILGSGGKLIGKATSRGQAISAVSKLQAAQQIAAKAGADHAAALDAAGRAAEAEQTVARAAAGTATPPIPGELPLVDATRNMTAGSAAQDAFQTAEVAGNKAAAARSVVADAQGAASKAAAAARGGPSIPGMAGQVARVADAAANIADWSAKAAAKATEFGIDKTLGLAAGGAGSLVKLGQLGAWATRGVAPNIVGNRALTALPGVLGRAGDKLLERSGALLKGAPERFGPTTQLLSDTAKAGLVDVPAGVAKGAVMDASLAAITNETPQDNAASGIMMSALGGLEGIKFGGARVYKGQQFNEHNYGSRAAVRDLGNFADLDAATETSLRDAEKSPGTASRLAAMREMFGPANVEMHLVTDPAQFSAIVQKYLPGMTGEALDNARKAGGVNIPNALIPGTNKTRNLAIFSELSAGEHEGVHGWQEAFSKAGLQKLNQLARTEYAPEWEQIGRGYMARIATPEQMARYAANGEGWREALIDFTQGSADWRKDGWTEGQIIDTADNYIANEVVADVGASILQTNRGSLEKAPGFPGKLARILGSTYEAMGVNPFNGAQTGQVGIPLKHGAREAIRKELINAKNTIGADAVQQKFADAISGKPTVSLKTPVSPAGEKASPSEIAASAPNTPGVAGGRTQQEIAHDFVAAIGEGTALTVHYHQAPGEPAGAIASDRQARRDIIELNREAPNSVRPLWEKNFWPESMRRTKGGEIQIQGWSPEVFAANAHKLAKALHAAGETDLSPYEIDSATGTFTENGWRELFADAADYSRNHIAGLTGAGEPIVVPMEVQAKGFHQPPVEGTPGRRIKQGKADVISYLMGIPIQKTGRVTGNYPRNLASAAVSEATHSGRTSNVGRQFSGPNAERVGVAGQEIQEVNPFRRQIEGRGVKPSVVEAVQQLNLGRIADVSHNPSAPEVRGREFTVSAGFAPKKVSEWTSLEPKDVLDEIKAGGKPLTPTAWELGKSATPDEVTQLRSAADAASKQSRALLKEGRLDDAMQAAMSKQFFSEAVQMAEGKVIPDPVTQFAPKTEAGKALEEKGFSLEHTGYPGFRSISVLKDGKTVGEILSATQGDSEQVHIAGVNVTPTYKNQGIADALYRELFTDLQADGVTQVDGYVVHPAPIKLRNKLLGEGMTNFYQAGKPISVEQALQAVSGSEVLGPRAVSALAPDIQFAPSRDPRAVKAAAVEDADGKIYVGSYHGTAIDAANSAKAKKIKGYSDPSWDVPYKVGFVTNDGKFLTRDEAYDRGVELGQVEPDKIANYHSMDGKIHTRDFKDAGAFAPRAADPEARKVAEEYSRSNGKEFAAPRVAKIDEKTAREIADWYDTAKHDPNAPEVKSSYDALIRETEAQYKAIEDAGYTLEPYTGKGEPYKSSADMQADLADNKHLFFLKTEGNFAGDKSNPMLQPSSVSGLSANDQFRAVHDFMGHAATGNEFGPKGELNAWKAHSSSYSEAAQPALAAETLAQNSWVNFGKHVTPDMKATERPFAEQKAAAVPQELIDKAHAQFAPKLPNAADDVKAFDAEHLSSMEGLKEVNPKYFGRGKATPTDMRGSNKSYFFVKGSKLGQDEPIFGQKGLHKYSAQIAGNTLYDLRKGKPDPLEWRKTINREEADDNVAAAGYKGMVLDTQDGRQVIAMFKKTPVKQSFAPRKGETDTFPELDIAKEFDRTATRENLTQQELQDKYPEAVVRKSLDEEIPSDIVGSPLYKQAKNEDGAVKLFADRLVKFAKEYKDQPEYDLGARWYSEFTPMLKKEFGKDANLMAELLAATSPQTGVATNFGYAFDALQSWKAGRFDKIIPKFDEGMAKMEDGSWETWLKRNKASGPETPANFMAHWIEKHNLKPTQSNGKLFGQHSLAVLKVFARRWMDTNAGPKTRNFVGNLLGKSDEATIDLWADRTMRWAGYEGLQDRWRILPENLHSVSDADYAFSEKAFRAAAEQLGMKPSALQGALWFAEKKRWSDNGWGRLDLGNFQNEMEKIPLLKHGFEQRLNTQKAKAKTKPTEQLGFDISPRFE